MLVVRLGACVCEGLVDEGETVGTAVYDGNSCEADELLAEFAAASLFCK